MDINEYNDMWSIDEYANNHRKIFKKNRANRKILKNINTCQFVNKLESPPETIEEFIGLLDILDIGSVIKLRLIDIPNIENRLTGRTIDLLYIVASLSNHIVIKFCTDISIDIIFDAFTKLLKTDHYKAIYKAKDDIFVELTLKILLPKICAFFSLFATKYLTAGQSITDEYINQLTTKFINYCQEITSERTEYFNEYLNAIGNFFDKQFMIDNANFYFCMIKSVAIYYTNTYSVYIEDLRNIMSDVCTKLTDQSIDTSICNFDESLDLLKMIVQSVEFSIQLENIDNEAYDKYLQLKFEDSIDTAQFEFNPAKKLIFHLCEYKSFIFSNIKIYEANKYLKNNLLGIGDRYKYQNVDSTSKTIDDIKNHGYEIINSGNEWVDIACNYINLDRETAISNMADLMDKERDSEGIHSKYDNMQLSTVFLLSTLSENIEYDYDQMISDCMSKKEFYKFKKNVPILFQLQIFSRANNCDIVYFDNLFRETNVFNSIDRKYFIKIYHNLHSYYLISDNKIDYQSKPVVNKAKTFSQNVRNTKLYLIS